MTSPAAAPTATVRPVIKVVTGQATSDGAGVRLTRLIGTPALPDLDPFLMLDEFRSDQAADYIAGFPEHPHRGFETVTYMLAGRMRHRDNRGSEGVLKPGGAQWMTAGRGILHSEMPEQEDGLMWGFQLWINLPARDKMTAPRYQDVEPEAIPEAKLPGGGAVRVLAGAFAGVRGPMAAPATDPTYLDVALPGAARFAHDLRPDDAAFAYVFEGGVEIAGRHVARGQLAVLGPGRRVEAAAGEGGGRFILLAGRPLREPVAKYGPFVMNAPAEIRQAIADFQAGRF